MKSITLSAKNMRTKGQAHAYIKQEMGFPDYYGENLDALWDMLTGENEELEIILTDCDLLREDLGEYGEKLLETFVQAGEENPILSIEVLGRGPDQSGGE